MKSVFCTTVITGLVVDFTDGTVGKMIFGIIHHCRLDVHRLHDVNTGPVVHHRLPHIDTDRAIANGDVTDYSTSGLLHLLVVLHNAIVGSPMADPSNGTVGEREGSDFL